jgi:hypothetical protein
MNWFRKLTLSALASLALLTPLAAPALAEASHGCGYRRCYCGCWYVKWKYRCSPCHCWQYYGDCCGAYTFASCCAARQAAAELVDCNCGVVACVVYE